ncbi:putative U6 snRNA-associated Sm-like protein LSm3 [Fusarium oxysporum f. sp. albedinis]|nr:putative U6 snRNA-associated Sm-like protein LSm3 [Fusarium oxysporum f. sp. albedinis]
MTAASRPLSLQSHAQPSMMQLQHPTFCNVVLQILQTGDFLMHHLSTSQPDILNTIKSALVSFKPHRLSRCGCKPFEGFA